LILSSQLGGVYKTSHKLLDITVQGIFLTHGLLGSIFDCNNINILYQMPFCSLSNLYQLNIESRYDITSFSGHEIFSFFIASCCKTLIVVVFIFSISFDLTDSFIKNGEIKISKFGINFINQFNFHTSSLALIASFKNSF
jgi:hypothetical protein